MDNDFIRQLQQRNEEYVIAFPGKKMVHDFADDLFQFLFIPKNKETNTEDHIREQLNDLRRDFSSILANLLHNNKEVQHIEDVFFNALPSICQDLFEDAKAILQFDPAAESIEEVLVAYPGFYATAIYRVAHHLYQQHITVLPRLLSEYAHGKTGIDIHPGAQIGKSFFIDHGTGIVIGESAVIGNNVKIYQGVTLGALNVAKEYAKRKRHPTIEDNVIIYSGATILGGETTIGHDSIIGGNVWLTNSVAPYSVVYNNSEVIVRGKNPLPDPLNFVI